MKNQGESFVWIRLTEAEEHAATNALPGVAIRYPEEVEGRFVPVEVEQIE